MTFEDYFWSKVNKNGPYHPYDRSLGRCWLWMGSNTGGANKSGYGLVSCNGSSRRAHRIAYEIVHKIRLSEHDVVRHSCDLKSCVRHTLIGTQKDNVHDAILRKRFVNPPILYGENNPSAKLTTEKVNQIRKVLSQRTGRRWPIPRKELAVQLEVSESTLKRIANNYNWRNI